MTAIPAIYEDLYQFSSYIPPIDLTFHQYLLMTEEPILVHTGSLQQAEALVPKLKEILGDRDLKYIFVSHFESDECGGLSVLLKHFPEAVTLCSEVTARQLAGFGITNNTLPKKHGEKLKLSDAEFDFNSYPSEMHLWEGLLLMENRRGIFFSSDLAFRLGKAEGTVLDGQWESEIEGITPFQVPNPEERTQLQQNLRQLKPRFAATGHGPCIRF